MFMRGKAVERVAGADPKKCIHVLHNFALRSM